MVKEDTDIGTRILRVSASDVDADNNSVIVYNLAAPFNTPDLEYFSILPESGWIVLTKPLDVRWPGLFLLFTSALIAIQHINKRSVFALKVNNINIYHENFHSLYLITKLSRLINRLVDYFEIFSTGPVVDRPALFFLTKKIDSVVLGARYQCGPE